MAEIKKLTFPIVNAYVIRCEETILFDTGCLIPPEQLPAILAENGVSPGKISLIVISHGHYDHCMLSQAWKDLTGAKVLCHRDAAEYMKNGAKEPLFAYGAKARAYQAFIDFMDAAAPSCIPPCEPDIIMDEEELDLHPYGISGKLVHTPGHDDSAVTLIMDDRTAFTGDTFLDLHTVKCLEDIYPKGSLSLNWINTGEDIIRKSAAKILEMADIFYTGHDSVFTREMVERIVANENREAELD